MASIIFLQGEAYSTWVEKVEHEVDLIIAASKKAKAWSETFDDLISLYQMGRGLAERIGRDKLDWEKVISAGGRVHANWENVQIICDSVLRGMTGTLYLISIIKKQGFEISDVSAFEELMLGVRDCMAFSIDQQASAIARESTDRTLASINYERTKNDPRNTPPPQSWYEENFIDARRYTSY